MILAAVNFSLLLTTVVVIESVNPVKSATRVMAVLPDVSADLISLLIQTQPRRAVFLVVVEVVNLLVLLLPVAMVSLILQKLVMVVKDVMPAPVKVVTLLPSLGAVTVKLLPLGIKVWLPVGGVNP